ncbi:MAG TPA: hypothetical protein VMV72_19700 [Verrucomicrobiae bacterium]|nr:hypothetical protein [Verrucomicrobiae bacterium]
MRTLLGGTMDAHFDLLFIALGCYGAFLLLAILMRAGRGRSAQAQFNKLHLRCALLFLVAAGAYAALTSRPSREWLPESLIGLFLYFGIHYAIVAQFFALAQASVSVAVVSIVAQQRGRTTPEACRAGYAGGAGFAYLKQNRLSRLHDLLGWVEVRDDHYRLTTRGRWMAWLTKSMLRLWGLRQMGVRQ